METSPDDHKNIAEKTQTSSLHEASENDLETDIIIPSTQEPVTSQNEHNSSSTLQTIVPADQSESDENQSKISFQTIEETTRTPLQSVSDAATGEHHSSETTGTGLANRYSPENLEIQNECGVLDTSTDHQSVMETDQHLANGTSKAILKETSSTSAHDDIETDANESDTTADTVRMPPPSNTSFFDKPSCSKSQSSMSSATINKKEYLNVEPALDSMEEDGLLVEQRSTSAVSAVTLETPVNLYVEDTGPKLYDISENLISKPLIPCRLIEAFKDMPISGRPKTRAELPEFQRNKIKEYVGCGLENEDFDRLEAYCSPENLKTGRELTMQVNPGQGFYPSELEQLYKTNKNIDELDDHNLNIVRKLKLRVEKDTKNLYSKRFKYRGTRMLPLSSEDDDNLPLVTLGQPIMPGKELLFIIRWYRPFPYNPKDRYGYRSRHSVFSNNIVLLGRHRLSALRDRVVCPNDVDMRVDVSNTPDDLPRSSAKDMFPSGFLFINNVFYVDNRPGCADYTLQLRKWAKSRGLGDFPARNMCDVRMDELVVKLGHPEVYVHQGNCEHLFTVSELRVLSVRDPLRLSAYPAHSALSQHQTLYCTTCAEFGAKWIVLGCARVPFDPAFFCEKCFKLYLYHDGKKIGDFKAYLYRGNEINALKPQG